MLTPSPEDSYLSLSDKPNPELIDHVKEYGGKLGPLKLISEEYERDPKPFDEIGIKVGPKHTPTIIIPGAKVDEVFLEKLKERYEGIESGALLIRGSLPGDYKSLVDVVPTRAMHYPDIYYTNHRGSIMAWHRTPEHDKVVTTSDQINETLQSVRQSVERNRKFIGKYATLAGVPFRKGTLSLGIVPKFSVGHISITEHPNLPDILFEEYFEKNPVRPSYARMDGQYSEEGDIIKRFLKLLREKGILDPDIAYNFELGSSDDGLVLYQVREVCRKVPIETGSLKLARHHSKSVVSVLTTIPVGASKIFEVGSILNSSIKHPGGNPTFGEFRISTMFGPMSEGGELDPDKHGFMTENLGNATLGGHHVMRQAQYALQSSGGGIVILGKESDGYGSYVSDIMRDIKPEDTYDSNGRRIFKEDDGRVEISHKENGYIDIKRV